jgi:hypothetical protein
MADWHLIAEHLVNNAKHYIGYYSALQIHNLITQPSLKEQIEKDYILSWMLFGIVKHEQLSMADLIRI